MASLLAWDRGITGVSVVGVAEAGVTEAGVRAPGAEMVGAMATVLLPDTVVVNAAGVVIVVDVATATEIPAQVARATVAALPVAEASALHPDRAAAHT